MSNRTTILAIVQQYVKIISEAIRAFVQMVIGKKKGDVYVSVLRIVNRIIRTPSS